jgi:hypothetical protein
MKLRARITAGVAAAIMLALPACHKAKPSPTSIDQSATAPKAASIAGLLDFNARETARIVGSAADRPARLDRMLVAIGQPDPNMLWHAKLRTSQPFACHTRTATMVRCYATLSWIGSDRIAGYANVMMYDHDMALADLLADRNENDPAQPGQTVQTIAIAMYNPGADGSYSGPYSTCRQAVGPNGNGAVTCFALIGSRTALWARLEPDPPAYDSSGKQQMEVRPNMVVTAIDRTIKQLRTLAIKPDGSFSVYNLPIAGPDMAFDGAGWYARDQGLFDPDSLFAGPYVDEQSCQADLPRANAAFSQFLRSVRTIEGCQYYGSAP